MSSATCSYGRLPMTQETCPGPTTPSIPTVPGACGAPRISAIAGGVSTWLQNTLKFASRRRSAARIASAVAGVVVSKPIAKNTVSRAG